MRKALEQYAGTRNKAALLRLLAPVHRVSEDSPFIRTLVDSGDIFHPLAWSPEEAYCFLKEADLYEASGVVVRARDDRLGREVAIKLIPSTGQGSEVARRRFRRRGQCYPNPTRHPRNE